MGRYDTIFRASEIKEYYNIIMRDFNAKEGRREDINSATEKYGIGEGNRRGEEMIEFANRENLKIAITFYNKKSKRKWSPLVVVSNDITKNTI